MKVVVFAANERLIVSLFVCFFSAAVLKGSSLGEISGEITPPSAGRVSDVGLRRDYRRTAAYSGRRLKIAAIEADSYFMAKPTPEGETYSGYLVDLVEEIWRQFPLLDYEWVILDAAELKKRRNAISAELTSMLMTEKIDVMSVSWNLIGSSNARRLSSTRPFLKSTLSMLVRTSLLPPDRQHPWSIEDLLNQTISPTTFQFGTTSSALAQYIKTSNKALYHQIWNNKTPQSTEYPLEEALEKIRKENFVLIAESTEASYASSREPCDLLALNQFTDHETSYVFATRRNETLMRELDEILARLSGRDFLTHLYRKWWQNEECTSGRHDKKSKDGEADTESDLESYDDMERIFFTSPVKSFRNKNDQDHGRNASLTQSTGSTTPSSELRESVKSLLETTLRGPVSPSREVFESRSDGGSEVLRNSTSSSSSTSLEITTTPDVENVHNAVKLVSWSAGLTLGGAAAHTSAEPDQSGRRSRTRQRNSKQTTTTAVFLAGKGGRRLSAQHSAEMQEAEMQESSQNGRRGDTSTYVISYGDERTRRAITTPQHRSELASPARLTVTWKGDVGTDEGEDRNGGPGSHNDGGGSVMHRTINSGKNKTKKGSGAEAPGLKDGPGQQRRFTVGQKFIDEFEWFFVTHRPRTDDNVIYDVDAVVDDVDNEQRNAFVALSRVTTTRSRQTTFKSNSNDGHRSNVKHFESSAEKSSGSSKLVFPPLFNVQMIFVLLCNCISLCMCCRNCR